MVQQPPRRQVRVRRSGDSDQSLLLLVFRSLLPLLLLPLQRPLLLLPHAAVGVIVRCPACSSRPSSATSIVTPGKSAVRENPACGFMQSLTWAELQARQGVEVYPRLWLRDGRIEGGAIFQAARSLDGPGILVTPGGPLVPWHDPERAAVLFAAIRREACRLRRRTGQHPLADRAPSRSSTAALCAWVRPRTRRFRPVRDERSGPLGWDGRRPRPDDVKRPVQCRARQAARGRNRGDDRPGLRRAVPSAARRDRCSSGVRRGAALLPDGPGGDPLPRPDGRGLLRDVPGRDPGRCHRRSSSAPAPRTFTAPAAGNTAK